MKSTKKSLLASALALVACLALLMGATFAWFTDSVSNTGNQIQAGTLGITAMAYDVDMSNTGSTGYQISGVNGGNKFYFEAAGQDLGENSAAIINENLWEPGQSNAKLLSVTNSGNLAAKVKLQFTVNDDGLQNALWFDFLQVDEAGTITGSFTKRPMSELSTLANALEISLAAGGKVQYILVYGMNEEAGNEYQGAKFSADVTILATQDTVETDGFGRADYDAEATFPVTDSGSLVTALERGGLVSAVSDFTWDEAVTMAGGTQSVLNLEQDAVITVTRGGIVDVNGQAQLTLQGTGRMEQDMNSELGFLVRASDDSKVVIREGTYISGLTCIQAGGNAQVEIYGGHFEALTNWNETYWLLNLIDNSNASITVYGGTFVNFDPSHSRTENPEANFVADGYKVVSETQANSDIWYTVVPE